MVFTSGEPCLYIILGRILQSELVLLVISAKVLVKFCMFFNFFKFCNCCKAKFFQRINPFFGYTLVQYIFP